MKNPKPTTSRSTKKSERLPWILVATGFFLAALLFVGSFRQYVNRYFEIQRSRISGYENEVLENVHKREREASERISQATSFRAPEAIERLRILLRECSSGNPPTENDAGWPVRLRAVRALRNYDASLQASAIPELMDLLTREQGYLCLEIREMLIELRCDALPATQALIELVIAGDPSRVELALSILVQLSIHCPEQFHRDKEAATAVLERLQELNSSSMREALIHSLTTFDSKGAVSNTALQAMIRDPKNSEELKELARGARVQMGLLDD